MHADGALKVGEWLVSPDSNALIRGELHHRLEPKTMAVLLQLSLKPGKVVGRAELLENVWPRTFSGDEALTRCVSQLRSCFEDDSKDPRYIETIPKKGYRLIATCIPLESEEAIGTTVPQTSQNQDIADVPIGLPPDHRIPAEPRKLRTTQVLVLLGAVAVILKMGAIGLQSFSPLPAESRIKVVQAPAHSIYVLPFSNLTSHPADDSFAEGIASTIRSEASKTGDIAVIAASSIGVNSVDQSDLRMLASEIGAATILTGSVQRSAEDLRITAQLVDGYSGFNIWSKSFDLKDSDIFLVQDEIAESVVFEIRNSLTERSAALAQRNPVSSLN
jgi:TolB-like protein/DNA-binding winged helix-turn-helix (wHTH) protein